jgi:hypothetical protein
MHAGIRAHVCHLVPGDDPVYILKTMEYQF